MSLRFLRIAGDGTAARALRVAVAETGFAVVETCPTFTVHVEETHDPTVAIDSVDGEIERELVRALRRGVGDVAILQDGGIQRDDEVRVLVPPQLTQAVVSALVIGLTHAAKLPPRNTTWRSRAAGWLHRWLFLWLCLITAPAFAQTGQTIVQGRDASTGALVPNVADDTNDALRTNCVTGCSGGTTDSDDGSVAGSQSAGLSIGLLHWWNGSAWTRLTLGQATMANSIPVAIANNQGALTVTDGSGALNVICDSGCGVAATADDSAFTGGSTTVTPMAALYDTTPPSITDGNYGAPRMDSSRYLFAVFPSAQSVNAAQSGTWTVLPGNTANTTAWLFKLSQSGSENNVDVDSIAAGDNNIGNVDIVTLPAISLSQTGTANDVDATIANATLAVTQSGSWSVDTPTNPARQLVTSAAVAAGGSANLDSNDLATKYLWAATFTASVPFKVVLSLNDNGSLTDLDTLFGQAGQSVQWKPPHRAFAQAPTAGAGSQGWRAVITNMDASEAADVYATFMYADN